MFGKSLQTAFREQKPHLDPSLSWNSEHEDQGYYITSRTKKSSMSFRRCLGHTCEENGHHWTTDADRGNALCSRSTRADHNFDGIHRNVFSDTIRCVETYLGILNVKSFCKDIPYRQEKWLISYDHYLTFFLENKKSLHIATRNYWLYFWLSKAGRLEWDNELQPVTDMTLLKPK